MKRSPLIAQQIALLLLFQLLLAMPTPATLIIVRRTPQEIVVGADSMRLFTLKDGKGIPIVIPTDNACKIKGVGNTFFATAGYAKGWAADLDPKELAARACEKRQTIMGKALYFEELITSPLADRLEEIRRDDPAYFEKRFIVPDALQISFFGFENSIPTFVTLSFRVSSPKSSPVTMKIQRVSCPGSVPADRVAMMTMGRYDAIDALEDDINFWRVGLVEGVRRLIEIQSAASPDEVGGPIDILRITKDGATWIQRKPECVEEESHVQDNRSLRSFVLAKEKEHAWITHSHTIH